jgi:hypothetical protein
MNETYVKHEKLVLKNHPNIREKWVQDRIAEDPTILGLGDLILKEKEKIQPGAGRLDLLFQDAEQALRYEVEIQLGKTDESHIIRTIEYWDIERKRYPQYDHVAVLIAEDVTSRFLNIINLFNGFIPLIAIQMNAIKIDNMITLTFTKVLDQRMGFALEDEEELEVTDRGYWEKRGTKATVQLADELLMISKEFDPDLELKYNKFYIGISKDGRAFNFVGFRPQKQYIRIEPKLESSQEIQARLEEAELDVMEYSARDGRYRIRLSKDDIKKHAELIKDILKQAYQQYGGFELMD